MELGVEAELKEEVISLRETLPFLKMMGICNFAMNEMKVLLKSVLQVV